MHNAPRCLHIAHAVLAIGIHMATANNTNENTRNSRHWRPLLEKVGYHRRSEALVAKAILAKSRFWQMIVLSIGLENG